MLYDTKLLNYFSLGETFLSTRSSRNYKVLLPSTYDSLQTTVAHSRPDGVIVTPQEAEFNSLIIYLKTKS